MTTVPMQNRPPTFDHLKKKKPVEVTVVVHHDDALVKAYESAQQALGEAEFTAGADGDETASRLDRLREAAESAREALEDETTWLTFRSIGRRAYDALIEAHPPTKEQLEKAEKENLPRPQYDEDSFAIAVVAASCVDPSTGEQFMTEEQVAELFDDWNTAEVVALYTAALQCNSVRRVTDLGKASGPTRSSGRS